MPDFRDNADKNGKLYVWADPGFAMWYRVDKVMGNLGEDEDGADLDGITQFFIERIDPVKKVLYDEIGTKRDRNYHGVDENGRVHGRFHSAQTTTYLEDGDLETGKEFLRMAQQIFLDRENALPEGPKYDKLRAHYRAQRLLADPEQGNLFEAYGRSPYLLGLCELSSSLPRFRQLGIDETIDGLNSQTDSKGNPQPAFDIIMDMMTAFEKELQTEFLRQDMVKKGWDDRCEARYLSELKAAHEETLRRFDRMWEVDDTGQYDRYLNNNFDHTLGKHTSPQESRDITRNIGAIRGEVQAIDNGWASDELHVLGFVGEMAEEIKRLKIRDQNDPDRMRQLNALEKDMNVLKASVWDRKVTNPQDKLAIVREVEKFRQDHIHHYALETILIGDSNKKEIYDVAFEVAAANAQRDMAKEEKFRTLTEDEVEDLEDMSLSDTASVSFFKTQVTMLADDAKTKLAALEKMTKAGHVNGREYNDMHAALKAVSELTPNNTSVDKLDQALQRLNTASAEYERTHDVWYRASKGYGQDRLNLSKELKVMAQEARQTITPQAALIDRSKTISTLDDELRADFDRIDRKNGKKEQVRELNADDLAKKVGVPGQDQKEDFTKKRQEIEQARPGFKLGSVNGQPVPQGPKQS